jgi:hypothetical protein
MSDQWSFFDPDTSKKVIITTFDDGNEQYKYYTFSYASYQVSVSEF